MHLLNWKLTTAVANDELNPADASAVKVYGTEAVVDVYHLLLGILGAAGYLREGSPGAVLLGAGGAGRALGPDQHLRGWRERDPAGDRGLDGPRHDPGGPLMTADELLDRLRAFEGRSYGPAVTADDPVNQPMIRHWVEAMGDTNPVYLDDEAAEATGTARDRGPGGHVAGLVDAGPQVPGPPGRRRAERAARPARGAWVHVGRGHQHRAGVPPGAGAGRPPRHHVGHRERVGGEGDRSRGRPLRHHPDRVPGPGRRAGRGDDVPDPQVPAPAEGRAEAEPAPAGREPRQRLLLRGGQGREAADPAVLVLWSAAPPARAHVPAVPVPGLGGHRGLAARAPSTAS